MNAEEYREHIDSLIRAMAGDVVLNGSSLHATIIVERMFAHANEDVSILSRRFDPRIYGTPELIEQAELFLGGHDRTAHIILEEVDNECVHDHPFFRKLSRFIDKGNLRLKKMPESLAHLININFAVMDERGYRFERDKKQAIASAAFGEGEVPSGFRLLFKQLWEYSADVPLPQEA